MRFLLSVWKILIQERPDAEKQQRRIIDISFTLSFSFLWLTFHLVGQLGGGIILLFIIYFLKSNDKARTWLTRFLNSKIYELELDETQELSVLKIKGKHELDNLVAFQYLCVDVSEVFFEMKEKKIKNVQLDLDISNASNEKMFPLIQAIGDSHGIELNSKNITPT